MKKLLTALLCLALVFALSFNAFAAEFTPSAEKKGSPEVVGIKDEDGNVRKGLFYDKNDPEKQVGVVDGKDLDLVLTAESELDSDTLAKIEEMIDEAKKEIEAAKTVGDLPSGTGLKAELKERIVKHEDPAVRELELKDLVVSDVFDISLVQNGKEIVQVPEGQVIKFSLQTDFRPGDVFFVLVRCEGSTGWTFVDAAVVDENGVMTITASQLCVMAFVVPGYGELGKGRMSPQTGEADLNWLLFVGGACIAAAAGIVLYKKKTGKN